MSLARLDRSELTLPLGKGGLVFAATEVLLKRIVSGEFEEDPASFPKEADLVEQYGVSRTVIREALRIIEEKGLIRIHQGRGTIAQHPESWNIFDPLVVSAMIANDPELRVVSELYDLRATVEAEMARRAATAFADDDLQRLRDALDDLDAHVGEPRRYLALDRSFHEVIMQAAGNRFGKRLVQNIFSWTGRDVFAWAEDEAHREVTPEHIARSHAAHRSIYELIAAGDEARAAAEMRRHVLESWSLLRDALLADRER